MLASCKALRAGHNTYNQFFLRILTSDLILPFAIIYIVLVGLPDELRCAGHLLGTCSVPAHVWCSIFFA